MNLFFTKIHVQLFFVNDNGIFESAIRHRMRVHLIRKETIDGFIQVNARSGPSFEGWLEALKTADWQTPQDINKTFGSADLLGNGADRVVFDIGGNNYRMICGYGFGDNQVHLFIKWIGTHAEYDKLNAKNAQYTVDMFKNK